MRWRDLAEFRDPRVPKLDQLHRARRAGLRVPDTAWVRARDVPRAGAGASLPRPPALDPGRAWMIRSASPLEDGATGSAAGRFHSERLAPGASPEDFEAAVRRVLASFGDDGPDGAAVFVQPFVAATRAGVAFFDGYHWERTWAAGDNLALTAGAERGTVERGQLRRGEAWSAWLSSVGRALKDLDRLDLEWAEDAQGFVLLQARRALFEVRRDPLVSLANHREILGPAPSPWIVSALDLAGRRSFDVFAACDPEIGRWGERYAWIAGGRAWMDFSAFFRVMDRWGLPRTFVTQGVGGAQHDELEGASGGPADGRVLWGRFLRSVPRLVRLQLANTRRVLGMFRELARLEARLAAADDLPALHAVTVAGLDSALGVNFALGGALTGVQRLRSALGVRAPAKVITGEMGREYEALRRLPDDERTAGLERWLARHGHRGPLESDPLQPRFDELREALALDLETGRAAEAERVVKAGGGPLFWFERRRELFRDGLMKVWSRLRARMLEEARREVERGALAQVEDVFFLTPEALAGTTGAAEQRAAASAVRAEWERTRSLALPSTARLSEVERVLAAAEQAAQGPGGAGAANRERRTRFTGVGLGGGAVEGRVVRADDLGALLGAGSGALDRDVVLLVPALEPAWGVLFGRVGAVVAELGGELSHASILLRELGTPAVVNCLGAWDGLADGERIRVDPGAGTVARLAPAA